MNKLHNIQAVAFDLDGTLVDSLPGLALAAQKMLADLSLPTVTDEQIKNWIGNGVDVLVNRILTSVNAPNTLFNNAKASFSHHYDNVMDEGTKLFPNVITTLQVLKRNGYPMALVTNKSSQFLPVLLKSLGLDHFFTLVLGGEDVVKLKPHPAPLYQVMATFGLFSNQLLFVGDSKNDIMAAKNAHCLTVGLTYGYNYGEAITRSDPDYVYNQFADILELLSCPKVSDPKTPSPKVVLQKIGN